MLHDSAALARHAHYLNGRGRYTHVGSGAVFSFRDVAEPVADYGGGANVPTFRWRSP